MLDKKSCLEIISAAIRPPETSNNYKNDPFGYLLLSLKNELEKKKVENNEIPIDEEIASTSTRPPDFEKSLNYDARIRYARALGFVYLKLSNWLESQKIDCEDEYQILSLQELATISHSFQFFVLTAVLPFLEEGVGLGASARSSFVKTWKLYNGDFEKQNEYLSLAANVILKLFNSNEALKSQLLKKFVDDVLAVRFQLQKIGINQFDSEFSRLFEETPRDLTISALMGLCKPKANRKLAPEWIQNCCGQELSRILTSDDDGLLHFLTYYADVGGENWIENVPIRRYVAQHLANVPKIFKKSSIAYHSNIFKQFLELTKNGSPALQKVTLTIFVEFLDVLLKKQPLNANLVVFDHLLRFWEVVNEKVAVRKGMSEKVEEFDEGTMDGLKFLEKMIRVGGFRGDERVLKIANVFMDICEDNETSRSILSLGILKWIANPGEFLYNYVMKPTRHLRICERRKEKSMVVEVGSEEKEGEFSLEMYIDEWEEMDVGVARRLEQTCEIINNCFGEKATLVFLELLEMGVADWMNAENAGEFEEEVARFVRIEKENSKNSLHAHLVVGCCFEQIGTLISEDGFSENSEEIFILLLKIVKNIITKSSQKMEKLKNRAEGIDIFRLKDEELTSFETMIETLKMTIGLTSGVLIAATFHPNIMEMLEETLKEIGKFVKIGENVKNLVPSLEKVLEEARALLGMMNCGSSVEMKLETDECRPSTSREVAKRCDVCEELIFELRDEDQEPAIRGAALIRVSRVFRSSNRELAEKLIAKGVFELVEELLSNSDSYVYLSAINCLGEMACYDREYLKKLIDIYATMKKENDNEVSIIRRGRIGEALGRIFRTLGEISIVYLDEVVRVFVDVIQEEEEILRASCCSALGDVLMATRGRGIEKWMDQVFYLLDSVILVDKSCLVRRAAVDLVRQCVRSCAKDVLQIIGERIRDVRRKMVFLWKYDKDDVVRLHAQLCIEELKAAMDEIFEDENSRYCRTIKI